jgi:hypothetical protein
MSDIDFMKPNYDLAFHIFCSEKWEDTVDDIVRERSDADPNYDDLSDAGEVETDYLIMILRDKWNHMPKSQKDAYEFKGRYQRWAAEEDNKLKKNKMVEAMTAKSSRRSSRQSSPPHQYSPHQYSPSHQYSPFVSTSIPTSPKPCINQSPMSLNKRNKKSIKKGEPHINPPNIFPPNDDNFKPLFSDKFLGGLVDKYGNETKYKKHMDEMNNIRNKFRLGRDEDKSLIGFSLPKNYSKLTDEELLALAPSFQSKPTVNDECVAQNLNQVECNGAQDQHTPQESEEDFNEPFHDFCYDEY